MISFFEKAEYSRGEKYNEKLFAKTPRRATKIKVGIIGYGKSAKIFHLPLLNILRDQFQVEAFFSSQANLIKQEHPSAKVYTKLDDFLSDPKIDLVIITTPNQLHYPQTKAALLAAKHVVVEKPFVVDPKEGAELIAIAKEKNLKLSVYHNRRWDKGFMTLQKMIKENSLGEINHYEAHFDRWRPDVQSRWRDDDQFGSGTLYDLGAHLIDQALTLFGEPAEIISDIQRQRDGAKATDYFRLVFKYPKMQAVLHSSCLVENPGDHLLVRGSKNSFIEKEMDHQEADLMQGLAPTTYQNFYKQMANAILNNDDVPVSAEDALRVIKIIYRIEQASRVC